MRDKHGEKLYWCDGWLAPPPSGDVDLDDWADTATETPETDDQVLFHANNYTRAQILARFAEGSRK